MSECVHVYVFSYLESFNFGLLFNQETQQNKGDLTQTIFLDMQYYKMVWIQVL